MLHGKNQRSLPVTFDGLCFGVICPHAKRGCNRQWAVCAIMDVFGTMTASWCRAEKCGSPSLSAAPVFFADIGVPGRHLT